MKEQFEIPVSFNNEVLTFPATLLKYIYTYKVEIDVNGSKILFERDEERNWRAIIPYDEINSNKKINKELLSTIALSLDEIVN